LLVKLWLTRNFDSGQGSRSDLEAVKEMLDSGAKMGEIADAHFEPFLRHHRAFYVYRDLKAPIRSTPTDLHVLVGPPGTGKSFFASHFSIPDDTYHVVQPSRGRPFYWDGYCGQATVVFDDFYGWCPYSLLLKLADEYPLELDCRGRNGQFSAHRIFITSNREYTEWWDKDTITDLSALERRFTTYTHVATIEDGRALSTLDDLVVSVGGRPRAH